MADYKAKLLIRSATSHLRTLPDFLIIGAAKSGSTSLYNYLLQHRDVLPCFRKEVHYFDRHHGKGINWYKAFFPLASEKNKIPGTNYLCGESSPYYLFHPLAPLRIKETLPEVMFLVVLRNPVDRAVSHYNHRFRTGQETFQLEKAFELENERLFGEEEKLISGELNFSYSHYYHSYVTRGIYHLQLERWLSSFDRNRFLILESSDLFFNPAQAFTLTTRFLNINDQFDISFKKYNSGDVSEYSNLTPAFRKKMIEFYKPHNEKLFRLLGKEFDWNK